METLVELQVEEAPEHPVLPGAQNYDIRAIRFEWPASGSTPNIEIEASTHEDYVVLRFEGVEELLISGGELMSSIRLNIQDTSQCPSSTHHIPPIRVGGTKANGNGLQFWANSVKLLNSSPPSNNSFKAGRPASLAAP